MARVTNYRTIISVANSIKICIRDHYFSPEGIVTWKKCLKEKIAEMNCLPQRCIRRILSAETTPVMREMGNLKQIVYVVSEEKNLQVLNR